MTDREKTEIRKMQANLIQISMTGRAAINLTVYRNLGLVKVVTKKVTLSNGSVENRFDKLVLTEKAEQIISVVI